MVLFILTYLCSALLSLFFAVSLFLSSYKIVLGTVCENIVNNLKSNSSYVDTDLAN